jgi:non-ribosomal peptide synthetase component E (peptide arylation enzyme)
MGLMSHIGSFLWALSTLSVGGRVVVARTIDSHELLPLLRAHQPTVLAMIPAASSALIHDHDLQPHDFESLRICRKDEPDPVAGLAAGAQLGECRS